MSSTQKPQLTVLDTNHGCITDYKGHNLFFFLNVKGIKTEIILAQIQATIYTLNNNFTNSTCLCMTAISTKDVLFENI